MRNKQYDAIYSLFSNISIQYVSDENNPTEFYVG